MSSHRIDLTSKELGRRRWPSSLKEQIVLETLCAEATVSEVAQRYDLDPSQIYQWRKDLKIARQEVAGVAASPSFLPVSVCDADDGCRDLTIENKTVPLCVPHSGLVEIQIGSAHCVRVGDGFAFDTLSRVLDVLQRYR